MKTLAQPVYALMKVEQAKERFSPRYYAPAPVYGATDNEALDAAKDTIRSDSTYVLVRLIAEFDKGAQTAEYKP